MSEKFCLPEEAKQYEEVKIFQNKNVNSKNHKVVGECDNVIVEGCETNPEELEWLAMPPKLCTYAPLKAHDFVVALETAATNARWEWRSRGSLEEQKQELEDGQKLTEADQELR